MSDNKETTTIVEVDDIATLLAQPGADSIMTPPTGEDKDDKKPNLFQRKQVDLSFLDKPATPFKSDEDIEAAKKAAEVAEAKKQEDIKKGIVNDDGTFKSADELLGDLQELANAEGGEDESKRAKTGRDSLIELTKKLIEKGMITPFEGEEDLTKYTIKDFEDLFEANEQARTTKLEQEVPVKFFDQLPDKLKAAAAYFANGGQDAKGIFRALAEYEEVSSLDLETSHGQEAIARQYLQATNYGNAEEIEEQLNEWKDQDLLDKKANIFKPKLDALQEQVVKYKVAEQEQLRKQQQDQAQLYMKNVYDVLEPGELNGIKLDKKVQSMLYSGLVQPNYPSINGKQTNLLGHLLEKYQFVDPKHDLIAEVLWHLADPDGFKNKLREGGKAAAVVDTVRKLKTEERSKIASSTLEEEETKQRKSSGLARPSGNFFKR